MKKIISLLVITILLIPTLVNAAQCDTSKVYIDSITMEDSKGYVDELDKATAENKEVNLNLKMSVVNDEIKYKLVLKNDSTEDYEINKNSISLNTDYLDYSFESDNNNIIKAKSTKTIYLKVKYNKEVDQSKFVNGIYQDNVTMKVNLQSDEIANPNTGISYILIISLLSAISLISLVIYKRKKLSTLMILVCLLLLPIGVNALCKCELVIDSKVVIITEDEFELLYKPCYDNIEEYKIKYKIGMSLNEFFNSTYYINSNLKDEIEENRNIPEELKISNISKEDYYTCNNNIVWPEREDFSNIEDFYSAYDSAMFDSRNCFNESNQDYIGLNEKINNDKLYGFEFDMCIG